MNRALLRVYPSSLKWSVVRVMSLRSVLRNPVVPADEQLAILSTRYVSMSSEDLNREIRELCEEPRRYSRNLISNSPCIRQLRVGNRHTEAGQKMYTYHLAVLAGYGKQALRRISTTKAGSRALTVSHLCGNETCANMTHLTIETKRDNDTRVHCHYCLTNAVRKSLVAANRSHEFESEECSTKQYVLAFDRAVAEAMITCSKICVHYPRCWSTNNLLNPVGSKRMREAEDSD